MAVTDALVEGKNEQDDEVEGIIFKLHALFPSRWMTPGIIHAVSDL